MFEEKYSRLKFWIISISLLIPAIIANTIARVSENPETDDISMFFNIAVLILSAIWINTLANRIRDFGSNPWLSLWALIPLVNVVFAFYYGIVNKKKISGKNKPLKKSLTKAVINHTKELAQEVKPAINNYINKHSKTDELVIKNHTEGSSNNMTFQDIDEDKIYEDVMLEIEEDNKVKSTWARALSQSDGNKEKAQSLYIKLRVDTLVQKEQNRLNKEKFEQEEILRLQHEEIEAQRIEKQRIEQSKLDAEIIKREEHYQELYQELYRKNY